MSGRIPRWWRYTAPPPEPVNPVPVADRWRHCRACDVKWHGGAECWCCGNTTEAVWP